MDNILKLSEDGKTIIGVNNRNITHITIPYGITTIGNFAFNFCSALQNINIPNSVTTIGKDAFFFCSALQSIDIPNSVTTIGASAFERCSALQSINIPNSVTTIGDSAFEDCSALQSINISDDNPNYTLVDDVLYDKELTTIIILPAKKEIEVYNIPNSVTTIGDHAFNFCSALQCINIPNSVTTIGKGAFSSCSALQSINIPNSVTTIGDHAFDFCSALQSINIPNSVTTIGDHAFNFCSALQSINIPNSVTTIGDHAFNRCSALQSINFPNSVTTIGKGAFSSCSALQSIDVASGNIKYDSRDNCNAIIETATNTLAVGCKNTTIPNSVTTIGDSAFDGCSALQSIEIPNSVTTIGDGAFDGCSALQSIEIPNSVTTIGDGAFFDCSALRSIDIPNSITMIGARAFSLCEELQSIDIPNSVTTIGDWAFSGCSALKSIDIPNSVTTIGDWAFSDCSALQSIHISITNIENTNISTSVFDRIDTENCVLYFQSGTRYAIQNHPIWGKFKNIKITSSKDFISNNSEDLIYEETDNIDIDKIYKDAKNFKDFETQYALSDNIKRRIESKKQKERIAILENHTCQICGFQQPYINSSGKKRYIIEVDHIIEKSKGGGESIDNLLVLCPNCHAKKTYGIITIDSNFRVYENGKEIHIRDNHLKKHI